MCIQVCHCHLDGEMYAFKMPLINIIVKYLARGGEARGVRGGGKTRNGEIRNGNKEMKKRETFLRIFS